MVRDAARIAKERRTEFLKQVSLLKGLTADELAKVADALQVRTFETGQEIIKEGDTGTEFFILETGSAAATKDGKEVLTYEPKAYFGELALLKNAPRAAGVVAKEQSLVLVLGRAPFRRLLGPLDKLME